MPFRNRIRIPAEIVRPQFPTEKTIFRKANGVSKTISSIIRKTFEGQTDYMPAGWHEKTIIALAHDLVTIEGDQYFGNIVLEGEYSIGWIEFLGYPTAPAKFTVQVTPFDATNSNCQTCEEATQLNLVDDTFPTDLDENTSYVLNLANNDAICCYPAVFSISGVYDANYLDSAEISDEGVLSIHVKGDLPEINNVLLLTYRVTCPNGSYDEAGVYANISGTVPTCLAPHINPITVLTSETAIITWQAPDPAPDDGYAWELFEVDAPGSSVQSGTTAGLSASLSGLTPGTQYIIYVHGVCGGLDSNNASALFTTIMHDRSCGQYEVTYLIEVENNDPFVTISYIGCNGIRQNSYIVYPNRTVTVCALQNNPGDPVYIISDQLSFDHRPRTSIEYLGECP